MFCAGADQKNLPARPIDALLLNTLDHGSKPSKIAAAQRLLQTAMPKQFIHDSSGFQLNQGQLNGKRITNDPDSPMKNSSKEINLAPKHVMEVAAILAPDIVVGLDFPIRKLKTEAEKDAEFEWKLQYNVPWAFDSSAWHKELCPQAKFFLPIQCYTIDQLDLFLSRVDGIVYDGVSMPIRALSLGEIALFMASFYQRGITHVHLLGTFSFRVIALCAFMSHHFFEWVSLDATTWRKAAEKGGFFNPLNLSRESLAPTVAIDPETKNSCLCPFCRGISFREIQGLPKQNKFDLLRKHNWAVLGQTCRDLYANATDIVRLECFLRARCKRQELVDEIITTLSLVEALKDVEIEVLQNLLIPPTPTRKPSKASRRQTVPA
jgi:queuine/archaeosine tRNA-ribosyltransferase